MNDPHNAALKHSLKDMIGVEYELTDLLPILAGEALANDAALVNPAAVQIALIRDAWRNT